MASSGETKVQEFDFWLYRREKGKRNGTDYEDQLEHIGSFDTAEKFWAIYSHIVRPSDLPTSNLSVFRKGVKPLWEDKANKAGGKFILRVKKELSSHVWEALVLAVVGNDFGIGPEITGCNISVRYSEDIMSLWNQNADNEATVQHIRRRLREVLQLPDFVQLEYKPHFGQFANDGPSGGDGGSTGIPGSPGGRERLNSGDRSPPFRGSRGPGSPSMGGWRGGGGRGRSFSGDARGSWQHGDRNRNAMPRRGGGFDHRDSDGGLGQLKWPRGRSTSGDGRSTSEGGGALSRGRLGSGRSWGGPSASGPPSLVPGGVAKDQPAGGMRGGGWGSSQGNQGWGGRPRTMSGGRSL